MKKTFIFSLAVFILSGIFSRAQAQIINTYAGTGTPDSTGDNGLATSAALNTPYGVASDDAGNVYIADYNNNKIRKIDAAGVITIIAGTGVAGFSGDGFAATAAEIQNPRGIAVDRVGNVYFSDYGNNRIRKITVATGIITTIAGNADGLPAYYGDGGLADTSHVGFPWGLTVDLVGNVYIADQSNCRVRKIDHTTGIISTIGGTGIAAFGGDGGLATSAKIQYPVGVALDDTGNIYVADYGNNRIRKINTSGIISTIAGSAVYGFSGDGGPSNLSKLYYPIGITVDAVNNIYIADLNNNRIRMINTAGIINTIAGNGTAAFAGDGMLAVDAEINQPTGVAVDTGGRIFIADKDNNRIRYIHSLLHAPYFTMGDSQRLVSCETELIGIDSFLSVIDVDAGQTETWSLISGPYHGSVFATYTTTSTGLTLYTSGLTYAPALGFSGSDSFQVRVSDGTYSDTTTIYVTIVPPPVAGTITGTDSVCPAHTVTLADTAAGGVWSSSNTAISTISSAGVVTGVAPGLDTIYYTVTNLCGSVSASVSFLVRSYSECPAGVNSISAADNKVVISPNPSTGTLMIKLSSANDEQAHFIITNITGQKVKEFTALTNTQTEIQLDEPTGVYFISAVTVSGKWMEKITVVR